MSGRQQQHRSAGGQGPGSLRRAVIILVVAAVALICFERLLLDRCLFVVLSVASDKQSVARPIASFLSRRPRGVTAAIEDSDVWGGSTRGWSASIVETAPGDTWINNRLSQKAYGPASSEEKIEALYLLARRTGDRRYVVDLYRTLQAPGAPYVQLGRGRLCLLVPRELRSWLDREYHLALPWSVPEFEQLLAQTDEDNGIGEDDEIAPSNLREEDVNELRH